MEIENVRVVSLTIPRPITRPGNTLDGVVVPLLATFAVVAALFPVTLFVLTIAPVALALALPLLVWAARRHDARVSALPSSAR